MAAKGEAIRPQALVAGLAVLLGAFVLYQRDEDLCYDFGGIWSDQGPLYLTEKVQDQAFEEAAARLRAVDAAGQLKQYTAFKLAIYLGNEFAPKCDWNKISQGSSGRAKQVWDGFMSIARYSIQQHTKGTQESA